MSQIDMSAEGLGLRPEDLGPTARLAVLAEFLATMLFVFIGAGAVAVVLNVVSTTGSMDAPSLVAIALAHGLR